MLCLSCKGFYLSTTTQYTPCILLMMTWSHQLCADYGCILLRTQIRVIFLYPWTDS